MNSLSKIVLFFYLITSALAMTIDEYMEQRNEYINDEEELGLGSDLVLDAKETQVNGILMGFKSREFREGLDSNGDFFPAARHFFHTKNMIETSNVFKIIKMMPKGGALHMHDFTVGHSDFAALNISYWPNLYYCHIKVPDDILEFHFFPNEPTEPCNGNIKWRLVSELREDSSSYAYVDDWFSKSMSMYTPTPETDYPDADRAWYWFEKKITTISGMVNYEPAFRAFYYDTLQQFYDDNVMYIEMRGLFDSVYRLDGSILTPFEVVALYENETSKFMSSHPDFLGAKTIYAPHRFNTNADIGIKLNQAVEMKSNFPDFFAGFDLVGQEDKGGPLINFITELLDASSKNVKFFFHSGETAWHGTEIDENLIDALLLNTTRIGHGYALASHPYLQEIAKVKQIAVELCPISNQVLRLIEDVRNHPGGQLLKKGFPIVIASDGPGIWASSGLSHDFYYAFMGISGAHSDIRFLKQLAINSIEYSAMSSLEKLSAFERWNEQWSKFLDLVLNTYGETNEVAPASWAN